MKFTLSWLREHLETDAPLEAIAERLSMIGLEVDGVGDPAAALADFVVGDVIEAGPHPNADRLRVCTVDVGGGERFEVVCGAPNARTGMKGVFARAGCVIPATGTKLKKSKIRGVESSGMLCSERELGLSDEHEGIIDLEGDFAAGSPAAEALGIGDPVIEIGLTPNRSDCAGVRGIARDLAAAGMGRLKPLDAAAIEGSFESPLSWRRDFAAGDGDACPFVVGRTFRNVRNGPSPKWLQDRLTAIGLRPISALVDITNYVTFDLARPLHVFDADKVNGDPTMRLARDGESVAALDGRTYDLDPSMTVIADDSGVLAIGGVMGGEGTGCGDDTVNVFLEVALFDPVRTATTGRKLGIVSDARYRFERGIDPTSALWGAEVAAKLILDICGGEASALTMAGEMPDRGRSVTLRKSRVATLGGVEIEDGVAQRILGDLGFEIEDIGDSLTAAVPPWRPDIEGEADLVEEVLRINGFEAIPAVPLRATTAVPGAAWSPAQARRGRVRRALAARGLTEAVTFSFTSDEKAETFGADASLRLANPISVDLVQMRPSILPNLLDAAARNAARGIGDIALFEIGPQFDGGDGAQSQAACGLRVGGTAPRHWAGTRAEVDAYHAKADALAALEAVGVPAHNLRIGDDVPGWYHPGRAAALMLGPKPLARFGEVHPAILERFDVRRPASAFEVLLDEVPARKAARGSSRPMLHLAALQPVERDFAFVVDEATPGAALATAARGADKSLIADVALFDIYRGPELGDGRKSVALCVTLQPRDATLTDAEIESVGERIVAAVSKATGAVLRG